MIDRTCGTCSACCRWPEIPALNKPQGVTCPHLAGCGFECTIYQERPKMCAEFSCSWLQGHGQIFDRPDDCGVLIDRRDSQFGDVLIARDLGTHSYEMKREAISNISEDAQLPCLLVADDDPERVLFVWCPEILRNSLIKRHPELKKLLAS